MPATLRKYGRLVFGAMAQPLHQQVGCKKITVSSQQADADAITRLAVRGLLTNSETRRARIRLLVDIRRTVEGR